MRLGNVVFVEAPLEQIPLPDGSLEVALSDGVHNLATRRSRALAETIRGATLRSDRRVGASSPSGAGSDGGAGCGRLPHPI
jgi:hypothetical protein